MNRAPSHVRSVALVEVIRVESVIGIGIEGDPMRPLVQFFDKEGNLLAERDEYKEVTP